MLLYLDIEEYRAERDVRLAKAACAFTWWTHDDICRRHVLALSPIAALISTEQTSCA
jgi:hypothetical protein